MNIIRTLLRLPQERDELCGRLVSLREERARIEGILNDENRKMRECNKEIEIYNSVIYLLKEGGEKKYPEQMIDIFTDKINTLQERKKELEAEFQYILSGRSENSDSITRIRKQYEDIKDMALLVFAIEIIVKGLFYGTILGFSLIGAFFFFK